MVGLLAAGDPSPPDDRGRWWSLGQTLAGRVPLTPYIRLTHGGGSVLGGQSCHDKIQS